MFNIYNLSILVLWRRGSLSLLLFFNIVKTYNALASNVDGRLFILTHLNFKLYKNAYKEISYKEMPTRS